MRRLSALVVVGTACGGGDRPPTDGADEFPGITVASVPATPNRALDILFVVDNSATMAQKQLSLGASAGAFVDRLATAIGGMPDLHLGVITTDLGTAVTTSTQPAGAFGVLGAGGCEGRGDNGNLTVSSAPVSGNFLVDTARADGTRQRNYTGELATTFAAMARVGTGGCAIVQPLAAMRAALANNPSNVGFLRPDATLAVVFVSDGDDCSAKTAQLFAPDSAELGTREVFRCVRFGVTCEAGGSTSDDMAMVGTKDQCRPNASSALVDDPETHRSFLRALKEYRQLTVSALTGLTEPFNVELRQIGGLQQPAVAPSCVFASPAGPQTATPGARLKHFVDQFPNGGSYGSICQNDVSEALDRIGRSIVSRIGSACLEQAPLDTDPATAGLQPECVAEDVDGTTRTRIPACDGGTTRPCWKVEQDAAACPPAPSLRFVVMRDVAPSPTTNTTLDCVVR